MPPPCELLSEKMPKPMTTTATNMGKITETLEGTERGKTESHSSIRFATNVFCVMFEMKKVQNSL